MKVRKSKPTGRAMRGKHVGGKDINLREQSLLLLREFGEDPGFLEQWMAQYLAELLERAGDQSVPAGERATTRSEIAQLVPRVWELREQRKVRELRRQVNDERVREGLHDPKFLPVVRSVLANPTGPIRGSPHPLVFLEALNWMEHLLLEFLWVALIRKEASGNQELRPDSFLRYDARAAELRKTLGSVLPAFDAIDLGDWTALAKLATSSIESMSLARLKLTGSESTGGVPGPGGTASQRPKKRGRARS